MALLSFVIPGMHMMQGITLTDEILREAASLFSLQERVRKVNLKGAYGFVKYYDHRDADVARRELDGQEFHGRRIVVDFARAADCKERCYLCGERDHLKRNCLNSSMGCRRGRSYLRSPSPCHGRDQSWNFRAGVTVSCYPQVGGTVMLVMKNRRHETFPQLQLEDPPGASHQGSKLNAVVHIMVTAGALSQMVKAMMTGIVSEESWSLLCSLPCVRIRFCVLRKALCSPASHV